jgi:geranylgeranyl diphosphate synthase, type I
MSILFRELPLGQRIVTRVKPEAYAQPLEQLKSLREQVEAQLKDFLTKQSDYFTAIAPELKPAASSLSAFVVNGGKRFRPLFAAVGAMGAGSQLTEAEIRAFASLELLQACALVHDDLMDASDTRRGEPAIHKLFESMHSAEKYQGSATQFGLSASVLIGDLALIWSDQMLNSSGIKSESLLAALSVHDEMRVELIAGQYLDVFEQARGTQSVAQALNIARYKSAKYTIERPLHLGAAIAIPDVTKRAQLVSIYSEFGLPLGEAFQLRDDLLGVFGDPKVTGKPAGDDLREGKRTVLMAMTHDRISGAAKAEFEREFGNHDISESAIARLQEIIAETGAAMHVEDLIEELTSTALEALNRDEIVPQARELLTEMAIIATKRNT